MDGGSWNVDSAAPSPNGINMRPSHLNPGMQSNYEGGDDEQNENNGVMNQRYRNINRTPIISDL